MKLKTKQHISGMLLVLPFLVGCFIFYFLPFIIGIYYSLTVGLKDKTFVGLQNYIQLFNNQSFLLALKNTALFMGIGIPALVVLSLCLGVLLNSLGKKGKIFQGLLIIPMIVPISSIIKVWQIVFDDYGIINRVLSESGIETQQFFQGRWAFFIVVLIFLWKNCGYLSLIYSVALANIPVSCVEAARIDGSGKRKIFTKIVIPLLRPTTFFVLLLAVINSFKIFREVFMLTGEYPDTAIYFVQHYMNNNFYNLNYQKLSSASTILSIFIIIVVGIMYLRERKSVYME